MYIVLSASQMPQIQASKRRSSRQNWNAHAAGKKSCPSVPPSMCSQAPNGDKIACPASWKSRFTPSRKCQR